MKNTFVILIVIGLIGLGWFVLSSPKEMNPVVDAAGVITVYKTPTCGCCGNYVAYLKSRGYEVNVVDMPSIDSVKIENNVPYELSSCHTSLIGDYVVEGHMPTEAIEKLLEEKPQIAGIALPAMPSGSPGMPGYKTGSFQIHSITLEGIDGGMFTEI